MKSSRTIKRARKAGGKAGEDAHKRHTRVKGSERNPIKDAERIGDEKPHKTLELTLSLRGPKLPSADDLANAPLTPAQFRKQYCASRSDADKVRNVLKRYGFKIQSTTLETRSMRVTGTVAAVEAAFQVRLGIYKSRDQREYRDREGAYKVPPGLNGIITAIL